MALVPIILSGGAGTRLWPLSREAAPKPFMPLPDGETCSARRRNARPRCPTSRTGDDHQPRLLLPDQGCVLRLSASIGRRQLRTCSSRSDAIPRPRSRWRRSTSKHARRRRVAAGAARRPPDPRHVSVRRAVAARRRWRAPAARDIRHRADPSRDRLRLHRMRRRPGRRRPAAIRARASSKSRRSLRPRSTSPPATTSGTPACSAFTPAAILEAFARTRPRARRGAPDVRRSLRHGGHAMLEIDPARSPRCRTSRIDYAVMEKAATADVAVVRGRFDWSDVGSWQAMSALTEADADGNRGQGERVAIDTPTPTCMPRTASSPRSASRTW